MNQLSLRLCISFITFSLCCVSANANDDFYQSPKSYKKNETVINDPSAEDFDKQNNNKTKYLDAPFVWAEYQEEKVLYKNLIGKLFCRLVTEAEYEAEVDHAFSDMPSYPFVGKGNAAFKDTGKCNVKALKLS